MKSESWEGRRDAHGERSFFCCRCMSVRIVLRAGLLFVVCRKHFILCRRGASWKDRAGRWSMFL